MMTDWVPHLLPWLLGIAVLLITSPSAGSLI